MAVCRNVIFLLVFFPAGLFAQADRYIIFFKDKTTTPYSISQPEKFLSFKCLERRAKQKIEMTVEDLPVDPAYVALVKKTGAKTFFTSRWMNCLLVEADLTTFQRIQLLPVVSKTVFAAPGEKLAGGRVKKIKKKTISESAEATSVQMQQLGLDRMQSEGYHGEDIFMAVFDGGFQGVDVTAPFQRVFQDGRMKYSFDFVGNSGNVYQYDGHGTEVFSVIAADVPGAFTGGAYGANYFLAVTEDVSSEYRIEEYNWLFAAEKADSAGVDIISTSLGYNEFDDPSMNYTAGNLDGKTAVVTRAAALAMQKGMVVICSAGNEGSKSWRYITPPADARGILASGGVDSRGLRVPFSSVGPTADNRIKPDVMALGSGSAVIKPSGAISSDSGTSFACPLVASLAAGVWQAYPQLTALEVYEAIVKSADQAYAPDNLKGYGLPNFVAVKNFLEASTINDSITIHPNPVSNMMVNVTIKKPTGEPLTVTMYDRLGRMLSESTLIVTWQNNPFQISVEGLSAGMYLIKVKGRSISKVIKLIKV